MTKFRVPIWQLMALVVLFAVGLAALKNPSDLVASALFTATLGLLGGALLLATARRGRQRLVWLAFSIFGWTYLIFAFGHAASWPPLLPSTWVAQGLDRLEASLAPSPSPSPSPGATAMPWQSVIVTTDNTFTWTVPPYSNSPNGITFINVATPNPNFQSFRQIGHTLATLLAGLLAALVVLGLTRRRRVERDDLLLIV